MSKTDFNLAQVDPCLTTNYPTKESTGATPASVTLSISAIIVCLFEEEWLTESTCASHLQAALA